MSLWKLPRVPEPEEMDAADQVESYSSAAACRHLDAIDNTFVDHLLGLLSNNPPASRSIGLDIGTGPAQIPIKVLQKIPGLRMVGIDRSRNMLDRARREALRAGVLDRLGLVSADGHSLPFPNGVFSLVLCNSVLHHARQPVGLLREMVRVAKPQAPLLLRDLRRPSRLALRWHLWRHGRHYDGLMRKLFEDSVRAAYTLEELEKFIRAARCEGLATFRFRGAHIGIERRCCARLY
jgi:ubiquinone/menaquinone biosynthesis C-methylase UbiE